MRNSRRDFLKTVGAGSVAAGFLKKASPLAAQVPVVVGPAEVPVTLAVNGRLHTVTIDLRETLLDTLRTRLDVTGTKRVCDRGVCGACTVIVDGRSCHACGVLTIEAQDRQIRTIEGVATGSALHAVQRAFCDQDAVMCGFCTPGCVMSAVALIDAEPTPSLRQVTRALDGHVCRCGAKIAAGVLGASGALGAPPPLQAATARAHRSSRSLAARAEADALGSQFRAQSRYAWPDRPRVMGTRVSRVDGPAKVSGRARFTADVVRAGLLHARLLRAPYAHARIRSIDISAAQRAPGVRASMVLLGPGQKAMYAGEEVAAVAATTELQAADAIRLIKVDWDVLPHLATVEQAMRPEAPNVFEPANTRTLPTEESGDLETGWRASAHVLEGLYSTQVQTHVCPETHGSVCEWTGASLTAWVSTQAVHATRDGLAAALSIPLASVRVIAEHVGGGFGSKLVPGVETIVCARLARLAGAPVKLLLDRKEEHQATGNRASAFAQIRAGVTADGALTAFEAQTWGSGGAGGSADFPLPYIYVFPHRRRVHADVYINAGPQRPMRGADHPQGCFITEVLMDELADAIRIDPLALRMKNLPPPSPAAMWSRYFPIAAERIGWMRRHPTGDPTPGPLKRGLGCAAHRWRGSGAGARARCEIFPDGAVVVRCGTQDIGTGTRTVMAVVAAETLGISVDQIRVELGDSHLPASGASMASATAAAVSSAVRVVASMAREQLFDRIAPATKALTGPLPWLDACKLLGTQPVVAESQGDRSLAGAGSSGVQFAEVEVDIDTGITRVVRVVCVQDCGLIVDLKTAESQCYGGIIAGINFALFEERILDRNTAQMVNPNMEFYEMAGPSDLPAVDVLLIDQPSRGVIGVGDPPTIATAAAIANAVRNASGVTVRSLPLTPDKLLGELERAGGTD